MCILFPLLVSTSSYWPISCLCSFERRLRADVSVGWSCFIYHPLFCRPWMGFSTPPLQPPWLFKQLKRVDSKFGIVYPWEIPGWVLCPALILQLTFPLSLCLGLCYAGVCGHFTLSQFARGASCLPPVRVAAHVANGMTACVSSDHKTSSLFFFWKVPWVQSPTETLLSVGCSGSLLVGSQEASENIPQLKPLLHTRVLLAGLQDTAGPLGSLPPGSISFRDHHLDPPTQSAWQQVSPAAPPTANLHCATAVGVGWLCWGVGGELPKLSALPCLCQSAESRL